MTLKVNEVFGPTIQGEGPSAGRHCVFIRLAQCNLHCSWCDTPYTWAFTDNKAAQHKDGKKYDLQEEQHLWTAADAFDALCNVWDMRNRPTTVVISGGEPMLQQRELGELISILWQFGHRVEIETAGTIEPKYPWTEGVAFNVSPKLAHSGNSLLARRNLQALRALQRLNTSFKFVVTHPRDYIEVAEIIDEADIHTDQVWIMPEGTTLEATRAHAREIIKYALERGWSFTLRNHVVIWGNERAK